MDHKTFFITRWDKEAAATRKVISRIPQAHADYRPDPKARTARELAWMIVYEEIALGDGLKKGVLEWADVPAPRATGGLVLRGGRAPAGDPSPRNVPSAWAVTRSVGTARTSLDSPSELFPVRRSGGIAP